MRQDSFSVLLPISLLGTSPPTYFPLPGMFILPCFPLGHPLVSHVFGASGTQRHLSWPSLSETVRTVIFYFRYVLQHE
jgi:hypothetical protein